MKALDWLLLLVLGSLAGCRNGPDVPPREEGDFREPDLVELTAIDPAIRLDVRYATARNFLGRPVYKEARAFLQRPAAEALARVRQAVHADGYTLVVFDGYRPWSVTKVFWDETPAEKRDFVADPSRGSKHNRGCAVDLTLADLRTGEPVPMPSDYDEFNERAHPSYAGGPEEPRRMRDYLRAAMEREGFEVYEHEWWHFDYKDWRHYRVLDMDFARIGSRPAPR
ncbi:MAG TPA: M15 family metallopeptidase [Planctomycetota bacterium]|nr:M15 family metallopeptidase [Planctomycetota bacterium]